MNRFAKTADRLAALQDARAAELAEQVEAFLQPNTLLQGRALDVGAGAGALAFALAPFFAAVVALDNSPELLAEAKKRAPANVELVEGDATALPFEPGSFDLAGTLRTLHHVPRPELVAAELARVTRPGGTVLVIDQIASVDPLAALELNRFERARDSTTSRVLAEVDLRGLYESNGLVLRRSEIVREPRELDAYLDLAGCEGDEREQARALAPSGYTAEIGWYLLVKPSL